MADFNRRFRGLSREPSKKLRQGLRGRDLVLVQEVRDHFQVSEAEEELSVRIKLKLIRV